MISRIANYRCPTCGSVQNVWEARKLIWGRGIAGPVHFFSKPKYDKLRCLNCQNFMRMNLGNSLVVSAVFCTVFFLLVWGTAVTLEKIPVLARPAGISLEHVMQPDSDRSALRIGVFLLILVPNVLVASLVSDQFARLEHAR